MNDTIMASVAAIKSRAQDAALTRFRSVRGDAPFRAKTHFEPGAVSEFMSRRSTLELKLDKDILEHFRAMDGDPRENIRRVLRHYVNAQG